MGDPSPERFGPFLLLRALGAGGMGSAHLALHAPSGPSGALLVVKRLHPALHAEPTMLERFVHEAEVASHVRHPNVASLVAMGSVEAEPFLVTEFVFGVPLVSLVERIEAGATGLAPLGPALVLAWQIVQGVRAIHEAVHRETGAPLGLLHRDVGARNVLVGYDGRARIIDLGLGKSVLASWQTAHEIVAGSPDYMPPEQAMGLSVDARADVYGLAVTVWELLAGRRRIRAPTIGERIDRCLAAQPEPIRAHRPDVSARLEALLLEAMQPEPERRLPAAALLEAGLRDELARLRQRTDDAAVAGWLDVACATTRARDARALEADRRRALEAVSSQTQPTRVYVGDLAAEVRALGPTSLDESGASSERSRPAPDPVRRAPPGSDRARDASTPVPPEDRVGSAAPSPILDGRGRCLGRLLGPGLGRLLGPGLGRLLGSGLASRVGPGLASRLGPGLASRLGPGLASRLGPGLASRLGPGLGRLCGPDLGRLLAPPLGPRVAEGGRLGRASLGVRAASALALLERRARWGLAGLLVVTALGSAAVTASLVDEPEVAPVTPPPLRPSTTALAARPPPRPSSTGRASPVVAPAPRPGSHRSSEGRRPAAGREAPDRARQRALIERIRRLRERSFEIDYQRKVTWLSIQVSGARSRAALDALERRIARLEEER